MAQLRELKQEEADKISDNPNTKLLGKQNYDKHKSLFYELNGKFYEIWLTNDSSCWVVGGIEYDSKDDLDL